MPEPIKDNKETSSENAENQTLKANLESIKKKQKKKSILDKLSGFFRGRAAKESEHPKATQDDQDNPKQYKSLRQRAIEEIESEHIYVKGGPEAIQRKMLEIEARDRAEQQQPLSVERVPHRHEKQNDSENPNESNGVGSDEHNPKQYKSLRQRAIEEIESEHIYVKGGPEAIQRKMLEIEARDRAEQQQQPLSVERVPHRHEKQNEQTNNDNSDESKAS